MVTNNPIGEEPRHIDERALLLDLLLSHTREYVADLLRAKNIPHSGTKDELRQRLGENLESGNMTIEELITLLDQIEGNGNQHIYLHRCSQGYLRKLKQENYVRHQLEEAGQGDLYNRNQPLLLPQQPTISSITHNDRWLRLKWVEKREWYELISDQMENGLRVKKYEPHITRGITIFRIDLVSGNAELMIQRLPRGTNYEEVRERYDQELGRMIDLDAFSLLDTGQAIGRIEDSGEVERRACNYITVAGGKAGFKSRSRGADYISDPSLKRARSALGTSIAGLLGNFYWLPCENLSRKIHTHIYLNRVGIFGECTEQEVNYVLSRIRHFAERTS